VSLLNVGDVFTHVDGKGGLPPLTEIGELHVPPSFLEKEIFVPLFRTVAFLFLLSLKEGFYPSKEMPSPPHTPPFSPPRPVNSCAPLLFRIPNASFFPGPSFGSTFFFLCLRKNKKIHGKPFRGRRTLPSLLSFDVIRKRKLSQNPHRFPSPFSPKRRAQVARGNFFLFFPSCVQHASLDSSLSPFLFPFALVVLTADTSC